MFARLSQWLRTRSAVRGYARRLGPQLLSDYGPAEEYTPAQIRESARRARLPTEHLRLGYAGFLSEAAFQELRLPPVVGGYHELRAALHRHTGGRPVSAGMQSAPENTDAFAGASNP